MLCALVLLFVIPTVTGVTGAVRFARMPDYIDLSLSMVYGRKLDVADDEQACFDAAYNASSAYTFQLMSFDSETGECVWYPRIIPNELRASDEQPKYWMRADQHMHWSALTSCLSDQDARYLLMQIIYENKTCALGDEYDSVSGLCTIYKTATGYDFDAGSLPNGTQYRLTRTQMAASVNYLCDDEQARKMMFNGTWYCYYEHPLNSSEQAKGKSVITGDYCSKLFGSTAHVVKISEPREYEYLYKFYGVVYLGATLRSGTAYQWYDGTPADALPWSAGTQRGGSNTLVRLFDDAGADNDGYTVEATTSSVINRLICKKPAKYQLYYDACTKFKTCS